jgi:hypothetical protein
MPCLLAGLAVDTIRANQSAQIAIAQPIRLNPDEVPSTFKGDVISEIYDLYYLNLRV